MTSLDEIDRRLGQIQDELLKLGDDEFSRRFELHTERDRLHSEAAKMVKDADLDRPSPELAAELKEHRKQLDDIDKKYINTAEQVEAGFGLAGNTSGASDPQWINQNIDEGTGRAKIEARIAHLEAILADRGDL
jgi:hypothetical protein